MSDDRSVRYYTTSVPVEKSMQEVASLLRQYGAQRFEQVWEGGRTVAVRFNLPVPEAEWGYMPVVLRPRIRSLARALQRHHKIDDPNQVERVSWRQLKGVLEGILMATDTGMFDAGQVLLGMAETPGGGSLWDVLRTQDRLALPSGSQVEVLEGEIIPQPDEGGEDDGE